MTTLTIDTLEVARTLKANGYTEQQATGFVEVLQQLDFNHFATKQDLQAAVHQLTLEIQKLPLDIATSRNDIMRWMCGGFFAVILTMVSVMFRLHGV